MPTPSTARPPTPTPSTARPPTPTPSTARPPTLAKAVEGPGGVTIAGEVVGTPGYMAPEQAEGDLARTDRRADVYGLGATLYAMLTGRAPFRGPSVQATLEQVRRDDPAPPRAERPELDRDLARPRSADASPRRVASEASAALPPARGPAPGGARYPRDPEGA